MPLSHIRNRFSSSFSKPLNLSIYKDLCKKIKTPAFLVYDGKIKCKNDTLKKEISDEALINFYQSKEIACKGKLYKITELLTDKNIAIYELLETNLFDVPYDIIPHAVIKGDGSIIKTNKLFESLKPEKIHQNKSIFNYIEESNISLIKSQLQNNGQIKGPAIEIKFLNKPQTTALAYFLQSAEKNTYHCYCIDITEYKNIELSLIHSQKMQAIGQLSGGIAHDFNNLLTAMLGFCDLLLLKHPAGDPSFAEIMQIKQNANRAANLVRQLLALSRKQVLKQKILDVSDLIADLAHLIRRLIGEEIELDIIYGQNLKQVKLDQGQFEQVIINLAVNARDAIVASGKPGIITISTKNISIKNGYKQHKTYLAPMLNSKIEPGEYVLVEVQDNGTGIPNEIKDKIFEPFFSTKEIGAGTGLGLSTVYAILNQIGAHIYIESQEGEGTKFYIYLKSETTESEESEMDEPENILVQKDLTGTATILLVEDEAPVRMFSTHALTNKGYKVIEASNGEEALKAVKKHGDKIDLIISDVIMPGINGPSLISEIQKKHPKMQVIFISGYAEEAFSDTYDIENSDDFHFLPKPFTLQQLITKVKTLLNEKESIKR